MTQPLRAFLLVGTGGLMGNVVFTNPFSWPTSVHMTWIIKKKKANENKTQNRPVEIILERHLLID